MIWPLVKAIVILPGTALVLVPTAVVWASRGTDYAARPAGPTDLAFWLALVALAAALPLMIGTVRLFLTRGHGTPAPWDPPKTLVVAGPYRYVRNPMITGVLFFLLAEALILRSWPVAAWMAVFFLANSVYMPLSEEPGLERRFGETYRVYKANVPRWLPRLRPWRQPAVDGADGP